MGSYRAGETRAWQGAYMRNIGQATVIANMGGNRVAKCRPTDIDNPLVRSQIPASRLTYDVSHFLGGNDSLSLKLKGDWAAVQVSKDELERIKEANPEVAASDVSEDLLSRCITEASLEEAGLLEKQGDNDTLSCPDILGSLPGKATPFWDPNFPTKYLDTFIIMSPGNGEGEGGGEGKE